MAGESAWKHRKPRAVKRAIAPGEKKRERHISQWRAAASAIRTRLERLKGGASPPVIQSGGWLGTVIGHVAGGSCREIWNLERLKGTKSPAAKNLPHGQLAREEGAAPVMQRWKSPAAPAVKRFLACVSE